MAQLGNFCVISLQLWCCCNHRPPTKFRPVRRLLTPTHSVVLFPIFLVAKALIWLRLETIDEHVFRLLNRHDHVTIRNYRRVASLEDGGAAGVPANRI